MNWGVGALTWILKVRRTQMSGRKLVVVEGRHGRLHTSLRTAVTSGQEGEACDGGEGTTKELQWPLPGVIYKNKTKHQRQLWQNANMC